MKSRLKYKVIRLDVKILLFVLLLVGTLMLAVKFAVVQAKEKEAEVTMAGEEIDLPVVMYHSLLKDTSRHGEYVISPDTFENDLQYLLGQGYETVVVQDLIDYVNGGTLPEKPIMITFDDGYYNNYLYAMEIAKKLECRFVISPIVSVTELFTASNEQNAYYSHLTWDMLKEMSDSGIAEVQNHSYDMHTIGARKGVKKKWGESQEEYAQAIGEDLLKAQEEIEKHVGKRPTAFAYPFGAVSESTPQLIKEMGFSATLTSAEKISRISRSADSLYNLGRFVRPAGISTKEFFEKKMKLP